MRFSYRNLMFLLIMLLILLQPLSASAISAPRHTDPSYMCTQATKDMERIYHIKQHLLTTIANVESGRWNEKTKQKYAWPWTINAQGQGFFFNTKAEAIKKVKELRAQGIESIDVGCMQINLSYHGKEFKSIEEALDPRHNVEYAAKFLSNLYETNNHDWLKAAATYHSSVPAKADKYRQKVVKTFEEVKTAHENNSRFKPLSKTRIASNRSYKKQQAKKQLLASIGKNKSEKEKFDVKAWREAKLEEYRLQKLSARRY